MPFTEAVSCNLLEDPGEPLETDGDEIVVPYRPHEIVSVLVQVSTGARPWGRRALADRLAALRVEEVEPLAVDRQARQRALLDLRAFAPAGP